MRIPSALLIFWFTIPRPGFSAETVLADFEGKDYGEWKATGEAFGPGPARGSLPGQMAVGGYLGEGLVNSFFKGDESEGTLTSPEFRIEQKRINFLVGGGRHPGEACIQLIVRGEAARTATGSDSEFLRPVSWKVDDLAGTLARIEIVDRKKGGWGHISVDHIVLCDDPPRVEDDRDGLLARAEASLAAAAGRVKDDAARPTYHVLPPGNWINDPNGPVFYKGWYHLFYQLNPYGDEWGNMHWGHVRSRDLARWERLPIALWPSKALGEEHVFSGCAAVTGKGGIVVFYTSIGARLPEQWLAVPEDDDLLKWRKHPDNPILAESSHGTMKVHEWRDPFVFREAGRDFMVCGGNLNASRGGQAIVSVYEAEDLELTRWKHRGILFQHPDAAVKNIECPNFFKLGGKWVLIVSQGTPVEYFTGDLDLDTLKFKSTFRGVMDHGQYYAPNCLEDPAGRRILWGWINGVPPGRGWRHCLTLPRVLSLRPDGALSQGPVPELAALRAEAMEPGLTELSDSRRLLEKVEGGALEINARLELRGAKAVGLRLRESVDGKKAVEIRWDGQSLDVAGTRAASPAGAEKTLDLIVFLDHAVVEVYAGSSVCVSKVITADPGDTRCSAFAEGGDAAAEVKAWRIRSAW